MSWINSRQFTISNRNGRHYVFRRNNAGNTEINIPASIVTKAQAVAWLKAHPNKVRNPTKFKPKRPSPAPRIPLGFFLRPGDPVKPLNLNLPCDKFRTSLKTIKAIGSGRQGKVFKVSQTGEDFVIKVAPYDLSAKARGEPQPFQVEFDNQKAVMGASPNGVVHVYKTLRCIDFVNPSELNMKNVQNSSKFDKSRQGIIVMEYCDGGSLASWLKTATLSDAIFKKIIGQVIATLHETKVRIPHFNHNDLHMENIFVSKGRGFLIGDFGWSRTKMSGTNPAVNTANGTATASFWGVGPKTDTRYDHHLFLNELMSWIEKHTPSKYPETMKFLQFAIPTGYRGANDTHVGEWRLKYGDKCPGLPSLTALVRDPYLRETIKSINLQEAKARLRKVKPPSPKKLEPIVLRRKKLVTSPMLQAALAKLKKGKPKSLTNAELLALNAAKFLKLSPGKRARIMALRAAAGPKKKANQPKVNATARKKMNVMGGVVIAQKRKPLPPGLLKSSKFNKLITKIYEAQNKRKNEPFSNAWNRARTKALNQVQTRVNANKPPFSPSPPKPKAKTPSPPKPKAKTPNFNFKLSPNSGRVKIRAPNSGRYVYANGATISLAYLKSLAARMSVNIKGMRSKANIAKKLFGR
jgi:serine/threonine protein kinase